MEEILDERRVSRVRDLERCEPQDLLHMRCSNCAFRACRRGDSPAAGPWCADTRATKGADAETDRPGSKTNTGPTRCREAAAARRSSGDKTNPGARTDSGPSRGRGRATAAGGSTAARRSLPLGSSSTGLSVPRLPVSAQLSRCSTPLGRTIPPARRTLSRGTWSRRTTVPPTGTRAWNSFTIPAGIPVSLPTTALSPAVGPTIRSRAFRTAALWTTDADGAALSRRGPGTAECSPKATQ